MRSPLVARRGCDLRRRACAVRGKCLHSSQPAARPPSRSATPFDRGSEYLLNEQSARGTLGRHDRLPRRRHRALYAGAAQLRRRAVDPKIQKSLDYLRALEPNKTYTVALQTMALCAGEPEQRPAAHPAERQLAVASADHQGRPRRFVVVSAAQDVGGDNSNSQFAVLALHEAERVGAEVDPQDLEAAPPTTGSSARTRRLVGLPARNMPGTGSMTCAGIGAWIICSRQSRRRRRRSDGRRRPVLPAAGARRRAGTRASCGWAATSPSAAIRARRRRLAVALLLSLRPGARRPAHGPPLHRRSRLVSRRRRVSDQRSRIAFSHYWIGSGYAEDNPHISTALALLFLSKGRRPMLMAKVKHGPDEDWNHHRSDVANLTDVHRSSGVSISPGKSSTRKPRPSKTCCKRRCCSSAAASSPSSTASKRSCATTSTAAASSSPKPVASTARSSTPAFAQFLDRVFPEAEYKLRLAGPEHPIWRIDRLVRPDSPYVGRLWTIEYGCRTCVVFSRVDLSCYWELARPRPTGGHSRSRQAAASPTP